MTQSSEEFKIARQYLQEMLEADDTGNFELDTERFEEKYLGYFTRERFSNDIKQMHERNGMNEDVEFLCTLRKDRLVDSDVFRFAWKGIYEKRDALIDFGIYKKNEVWYVIRSVVYRYKNSCPKY